MVTPSVDRDGEPCLDAAAALVKFICSIKTPRGVLMTSLCFRGLYFVGNLCFLWVNVTFRFINRLFLFVFAQLLKLFSLF